MWWCRDISQTCLMLPVSASSRWWTRNASCRSGARRPVTGSRNQSGSALSARRRTQHGPRPGQDRVGGVDQAGRERPAARRRWPTPAAVDAKARSGRVPRGSAAAVAGLDLAAGPESAPSGIQRAVDHLGRRHPAKPP